MKGEFPISKYKVYVDDPSEVPDEYEVQEGPDGGLYYETEPGEGSGSSEDLDGSEAGSADSEEGTLTEENLSEWDGYEVNEFDDMSSGITQIFEGDRIFVEHPDGDYIAEVDNVVPDPDNWYIEFGDGTYHLDPDTTSQPAGVVEEMPELGPLQSLDENPDNIDAGDTIKWEDDAGFPHFGEVEVGGGPQDAIMVEGRDDPIHPNDVEGKVVSDDPISQYEVPEPGEFDADVDPEDAVQFNEDLVTAITEGDATTLPAYEYMSYAGAIEDPNLAVDAYESLLENDYNKTQRERMERRLRGMGLDPEDYQDNDVDPLEVPEIREDTVFSGFDSEKATDLATFAASGNHFNNWETWNEFFDHMTDEELEMALEKAVEHESDINNIHGLEPLDHEDQEIELEDHPPDRLSDGITGVLSRMPEGSADTVLELAEENPELESNLKNYGASFLKSAEDRRKVFEETEMNHRWGRIQFDESLSPEDRMEKISNMYTTSTNSKDVYGLRAAMWEYSGSDDDMVNGYNKDRPIGAIEPSEELVEAVEYNQEELIRPAVEENEDPQGYPLDSQFQDRLNDDGTITLHRGVKDTVTGHSPVESWTVQEDTAESFDGAGVLEVDARPEDILVSFDVNHKHFGNEKEVTLLGGQIAGRAKAVQGDPIEMMLKIDPDEGDFFLAPDHSWVEAALFDDMFDPGMGPRMEEAREESEEAAEEIADKASERLSKKFSKEWVEDPSEQAESTRWRNTDTGEYRYQESKPGEGSSSSASGGDSGGEVDFTEQVSSVMEEHDGDPVGEIAANEWQSMAGQIDDPDLLVDALDPIQDHGTKTARDRIRRRLRGLGWEPDEIDEALSGESEEEEQTSHDEWQESYDDEKVTDIMSLGEAGASTGVNAGAMEVHKLEDGTEAYVMDATPDNVAGFEDDVQRQQVTYEVLRGLDASVPPHKLGEGWYAAREVDGKPLWEAPGSWSSEIEKTDYVDEMAKQFIAGNSDCHGDNVSVNEEGEISVFDLDHSAGKLDEDPAGWGQDVGEKALERFEGTAMDFQINDINIKKDIRKRAESIAEELVEEDRVDEVIGGASEYNEEMAENIRYNIELLAEGGYSYL